MIRMQNLFPLKYHKEMTSYLKVEHSEVWDWFSSVESRSNYSDEVELHLLKTTYRMERDNHENLYSIADEVLTALDIDVPFTLYKSQETKFSSAALYFTPGHGHVVLVGGIMDLLDDEEMKALMAHEFSHFKLWSEESGDYLITDQILNTMRNEPRAENNHMQSARLFQLYTEIYADKGGVVITDEKTIISTLIKVHTGMKEADVNSYIKQAEEIFSKSTTSTQGITHPELFIRVKAIRLLSECGSEAEYEDALKSLIEGKQNLDNYDLLGQQKMTKEPEVFLNYHLRHKWLQSGRVMSHLRHFFIDFEFLPVGELMLNLEGEEQSIRDYYTYLLLDFASVDPELEEDGIAAAFQTAEKVGIADDLESLIRKELRVLKKDAVRIRKNASKMIEKASSKAVASN